MAKITRARARAGMVVALALIGPMLGQDVVRASQRGPGTFEQLAPDVVTTTVRPNVNASGNGSLPAPKLGSEDGAFATVVLAPPPPPPPPAPPPPLVVPTSPSEWFNPRGQHEGTEGIVADLAKLGVADNSPLYVNECWGRTWGAATSDHHYSQSRSWACDLSVAGIQSPTPQAHEAARRIGSALGQAGWKGGNLTKTINGYRVQVLWMVEGHFNHVHIGVRKL